MIKIKGSTIHSIYIFLIAIYIFFAHLSIFSKMVNINVTYLGISVLYLFYCVTSNFKKLKINGVDILIIVFILYVLISSFVLSYKSEGIEYMIFLTVVYIISICLEYNKGWSNKFINVARISAIIHCVFIILHAIFPDAILALDKYILTSDAFETVKYATANNYYSGISIGPASAGLFSTILIGIEISNIFVERKVNKNNVISTVIGILALIFSKKRAFVVAVILSTLIIILIIEKVKNNNKKIVEKILLFIFLLILMITALSIIPQTKVVIDRFLNNDRMLSGRETMYEVMLQWFNENKLFGVGLGQAESTFGYGGHNIYLQMLAECGIIGAIIFFSYLLGKYFENLNTVKKYKIMDSRTLFAIFIGTTLFIYGLTGNPIYDCSYLVFFMYVLAIPSSVKREVEVSENS